jgi:hypothetical protein
MPAQPAYLRHDIVDDHLVARARKGAHGGYTAIIDRIVTQIYWLRTNEPKVIGLVEAQQRERKRPR